MIILRLQIIPLFYRGNHLLLPMLLYFKFRNFTNKSILVFLYCINDLLCWQWWSHFWMRILRNLEQVMRYEVLWPVEYYGPRHVIEMLTQVEMLWISGKMCCVKSHICLRPLSLGCTRQRDTQIFTCFIFSAFLSSLSQGEWITQTKKKKIILRSMFFHEVWQFLSLLPIPYPMSKCVCLTVFFSFL